MVSYSNKWQKPRAVIVDMDGTLVNVSSIRHYVREALLPDGSYSKKNFDDFHKASLFCPAIWTTVDKVQWYWENRLDVLVVTARGREHEKTTRDWLYKYAVPYSKLFMRDIGDFLSDVDVKRDILAEIEKTWRVVHAIDDNPNVIALWEEKGIPVTIVPGWED
jgi:predicted secreted acid phosphatase